MSDWRSDVFSSDLIHVAISATGFAPVTSALFLADDPYIDSDAVFAVKESLKVVCSASALLPPLGCHDRSEEHTSELQSLMRTSYAVFCLKKNKITYHTSKSKYIQIHPTY